MCSLGLVHKEPRVVERTNYDAIYSNMHHFGFAKATDHVPVVGRDGEETPHARRERARRALA